MENQYSNRRIFKRFLINTGAFILKDFNSIRMGPLFDISLDGFAFCMAPVSDTDTNNFSKGNLSILIDDVLIDNFSYKIAYVIGKNGDDLNDDRESQVHIGVEFIDLDARQKKELEIILDRHCFGTAKDRRRFNERRTGLNRRRCDLPQYKSGFRDGRDRRCLVDRRNH